MISCPDPACFLADCHLPLVRVRGREEDLLRVVRFLRSIASHASTLFLVGDLFDFWFEWRRAVPRGVFPVLAALHELVRDGKRVFFLAGNHDGHPGDFLAREVGLEVHRGAVDAEIRGKRFHVVHGDGIAAQDRGYRALRTVVRWQFTEKVFRLVHPDIGVWLAAKLSRVSRSRLSREDKFGPEPYRRYARAKLDAGFNYVVMGHRHVAEWLPHPNGGYLSVGGWMKGGGYGIFEGGELKLEYFQA